MTVPSRLAAALALLLASVIGSSGFASDDALLAPHLSLDEAVRLLRARGLDLLIADASVAAADADVYAAGAIPNPQLSLGGGRSFTYDSTRCAGCSDLGWSAALSDSGALADVLVGHRGLRLAVARAALAAARQGREDALRQLEFEVRQQYVLVARAQGMLRVLREEGAVWRELLELTRARQRAGAISEADVAKAETATLSAEQEISRSTQELASAKAALAYLLGARGGFRDFDVDDAVLNLEPNARLLAVPLETLLALARDARPDLKAAMAQEAAAEGALAVAKRLRAPAVEVSVQAAGQGTGQNALIPPTLSVGVALTPPLLYQYQGEIGRAQAVLRQDRLQRQKVEAQVASDITVARASYAASAERVARMRSALLASAQRARDIVRVQYEKGATSFLDLLDAQRTYLDVKREAIQTSVDHTVAWFQVKQAIGKEPAP